MNALDARERRRTQRPLVTFGLLGPLALLIAMVGVGTWVWSQAEGGAREALTRQTLDANLGTAQVIAAVVNRNLSAVKRRVSREAERKTLQGLMSAETKATGDGEKGRIHAELQTLAEGLHEDYKDRHFHNWVVADRNAVVIARAPFDAKVVGSRYAYREWFTGRPETRPEDVPPDVAPRDQVGLTLAFKSTATDSPLLISVASPIWSPETENGSREVLGVLSATIHLRTFNEWLKTSEGPTNDDGCPTRMAILINRDQLVRHPCPSPEGPSPPLSSGLFFDLPTVQNLLGESDRTTEGYHDPLRPGQTFLAAFSRLETSTGWIAIVQHNYAEAMRPVTDLSDQISWLGWMALAAGLTGVGVLWVLLFRVTRERTATPTRKPLTILE